VVFDVLVILFFELENTKRISIVGFCALTNICFFLSAATNLPFVSASGREFSGTGHSQNYITIFTTFAGGSSTIFAIGAQPAVASVDLSLTYFV
jgi:preprotein translocase subunit SecY